MTLWVALLYSVILTPQSRVTSQHLTGLATDLGLAAPRSVLATGNLIFRAEGEEAALASRIEQAIAGAWNRPIPVLVRSAADWQALVVANPFPVQSRENPARVAVRVMRDQPDAAVLAQLRRRCAAGEGFAARPRALWLASPSQLSTPLFRAMASPRTGTGTFRNVSALGKIAAALD